MKLRSILATATALWVALVFQSAHAQEAKPAVIRIGSGSTGLGKPQTGATMGILQNQGLLEEEFKKDGIKIEWSFFHGLGPAQNGAFANDSLDFGYQGNLSAIIGKANGVKLKVLSATCVRQNNYIGVKTDSPIKTIQDLKGKRIAVQIGGPTYLFFNRLLESNGLSIKDVVIYNLVGSDAIAALLSNQVDVTFGINLLALADQGSVRIIYTTQNAPDLLKNIGALTARESFIQQYPEITERVVKCWIEAAQWGSEDANRSQLFQIWARGGTTIPMWNREYAGRSGKWITTPLLDPFFYEHNRQDIALCKEVGVIRDTFDVNDWIDPSFQEAALKELGLEKYWTAYDAQGNEIKK